jgi:hypothetical protein
MNLKFKLMPTTMIDNHPNITQQSHPNISSKHNATIAKTMTFFLGNLVEVGKEYRTGRRDSDGGRAYILAINNDDNDDDQGTKRSMDSVTYNVKYVVGGTMSPNVKRRRISPVIMETTARQQLGETASRPSLLSRHHIPTRRTALDHHQSS